MFEVAHFEYFKATKEIRVFFNQDWRTHSTLQYQYVLLNID